MRIKYQVNIGIFISGRGMTKPGQSPNFLLDLGFPWRLCCRILSLSHALDFVQAASAYPDPQGTPMVPGDPEPGFDYMGTIWGLSMPASVPPGLWDGMLSLVSLQQGGSAAFWL